MKTNENFSANGSEMDLEKQEWVKPELKAFSVGITQGSFMTGDDGEGDATAS